MRLLLDECCSSRDLATLLAAAGFDVELSAVAVGFGALDPAVFAHALSSRRTIVTMNCDDFIELAKRFPKHSGILLVYQDNDNRNMLPVQIFEAIKNVARTYPKGIKGMRLSLRQFSW